MVFSKIAGFDVIRTLGFASISSTYAAVGTAFAHKVRAFSFVNATAGDMFFTFTNGSTPASDGTADAIFVPTATVRVYDVSANSSHLTNDPAFVLPEGTQVWVRSSTAATSKGVYVECLIAVGE
jgi:hypothetical protein